MKIENTDHDFEKGLENGLENLEKGNYEGYLSSEINLDWLLEQKTELKTEHQANKEIIETTKNKTLEIINQKQSLQASHNEQSHLASQIEDEIQQTKNQVAELVEKNNTNRTPYPFLAGILYLLAGLTFVGGDLIISHEIVAYALNIRNTFEAWAFAFGLAGVSVLLKPAYERLIEQPYLTAYNPKTKRNYGYFQIVLVAISIGTLSILGWFRYEAYKTDKLKEGINRQIKTLQLEATPLVGNTSAAPNPALTIKIEEKLREYNLLNQKLVNSPWAKWSFVLSGVLFAIAGAICLGIAFPILAVYWKRWLQIYPAKRMANRRIKKNIKLLNQTKKPWFETETSLALANEKLGLLPDIKELKDRNRKIEDELAGINEKIKLAIESGRVSIYSEGYEVGNTNRSQMSEEEFENYRKQNLENLHIKRANSDDKTHKTLKTNGLRPHQALRKAISETFNEN
jgi:hypothetical protein